MIGIPLDASSGSNSGTIIVEFDKDTPSPLTLSALNINSWLLASEINITQEFDDVATTISLGTSGDNEEFVAINEVSPNQSGYSMSDENNFKFLSADTIYLFINAGTSTQGAGNVQLLVKL